MADINLLQNQIRADSGLQLRKYLAYGQMIALVLLILTVLAGAGLYIWNKVSVKSQTEAVAEIEQRKIDLEASMSEKRDEIVKTQAQFYYAGQIFEARLYWTNFLELINSAAISGVRFKMLSGGSDGTATISGEVPDLPTLALLTQKLNELEGVTGVILNSSSLSDSSFQIFYNFSLTLKFEPEILKFKEGQPL